VENETFNTLKNLGYNLEHNYGHGKQNLSTVFATLMMLAFLIDQIQEACCQYFQAARARLQSRTALWEKMRGMFREHLISDWESFYAAIIWGYEHADLTPKGIRSG
jgi:divalent metal cation (Fe/Co/Zn/Cd) transporter